LPLAPDAAPPRKLGVRIHEDQIELCEIREHGVCDDAVVVVLRISARRARRIESSDRHPEITKIEPSLGTDGRDRQMCDRKIAGLEVDKQRGRQQFRRQRFEQ
jgi:hypothetical protein